MSRYPQPPSNSNQDTKQQPVVEEIPVQKEPQPPHNTNQAENNNHGEDTVNATASNKKTRNIIIAIVVVIVILLCSCIGIFASIGSIAKSTAITLTPYVQELESMSEEDFLELLPSDIKEELKDEIKRELKEDFSDSKDERDFLEDPEKEFNDPYYDWEDDSLEDNMSAALGYELTFLNQTVYDLIDDPEFMARSDEAALYAMKLLTMDKRATENTFAALQKARRAENGHELQDDLNLMHQVTMGTVDAFTHFNVVFPLYNEEEAEQLEPIREMLEEKWEKAAHITDALLSPDKYTFEEYREYDEEAAELTEDIAQAFNEFSR